MTIMEYIPCGLSSSRLWGVRGVCVRKGAVCDKLYCEEGFWIECI